MNASARIGFVTMRSLIDDQIWIDKLAKPGGGSAVFALFVFMVFIAKVFNKTALCISPSFE
ncbi:hypothetical protein [Rhodomicrobium vannielii]|uniref:hypothetical protein n=1 Tax=Rhodomicrobium vannielii TaxID=1069 RepID=UPI0005A2EAFA|nr:hypothetical protein [Rhodomicrobium vannielii]